MPQPSINLSIAQNQAPVNLTPSTVTLQPCPWCCQDAVAGLSPIYTQQDHHGPCSHCGGCTRVWDGIRPVWNGTGGYIEVYVQGVVFGDTDEDRIYSMVEAAEIYNEHRMALKVELDRIGGIVRGQEKLEQRMREFNETEILFN